MDQGKMKIIWMVLAGVFLLIGLPFSIHTVYGWNEILTGDNYDYSPLSNVTGNVTFEGIGGDSGKFQIPLLEAVEDGGNIYYYTHGQYNYTVWTNETALTAFQTDPGRDATPTMQQLWIPTTYRLQDILDGDLLGWQFDINYTHEFRVMVACLEVDANNVTSFERTGTMEEPFWTYGDNRIMHIGSTNKSQDYVYNFDILETLERKSNYENARVVIILDLYNPLHGGPEDAVTTTGDSITWKISAKTPKSGGAFLTGELVMQIFGIAGGVGCGLIALASTKYWNPTKVDDPGPVGLGIRWVRQKVGGLFNKKKKKGGK